MAASHGGRHRVEFTSRPGGPSRERVKSSSSTTRPGHATRPAGKGPGRMSPNCPSMPLPRTMPPSQAWSSPGYQPGETGFKGLANSSDVVPGSGVKVPAGESADGGQDRMDGRRSWIDWGANSERAWRTSIPRTGTRPAGIARCRPCVESGQGSIELEDGDA